MAVHSINVGVGAKNDLASVDTEQLLWDSFRGGDRSAFARIYELYAPKLLSYGRKITTDSQRIEDSIQDLFVELWKGRANLSPTTSIKFYLFRALRNKLSRFRIDLSVPDTDTDGAIMPENLLSFPFEAEWIAHEEETAQTASLQQAIGCLSKRQQQVIHLRYYQHFDSHQIADLLGIHEQSVRNLLHTALHALRQSFILLVTLLVNSLLT